jgi:hypothetical protein
MLINQASNLTPRSSGVVNNATASAAIWQFYHNDPEHVLFKVGGFLKIRVKDLRFLFEILAGPEN